MNEAQQKSIALGREFLEEITDAIKIPKIPIWVRRRADNILKDFPTTFDPLAHERVVRILGYSISEIEQFIKFAKSHGFELPSKKNEKG